MVRFESCNDFTMKWVMPQNENSKLHAGVVVRGFPNMNECFDNQIFQYLLLVRGFRFAIPIDRNETTIPKNDDYAPPYLYPGFYTIALTDAAREQCIHDSELKTMSGSSNYFKTDMVIEHVSQLNNLVNDCKDNIYTIVTSNADFESSALLKYMLVEKNTKFMVSSNMQFKSHAWKSILSHSNDSERAFYDHMITIEPRLIEQIKEKFECMKTDKCAKLTLDPTNAVIQMASIHAFARGMIAYAIDGSNTDDFKQNVANYIGQVSQRNPSDGFWNGLWNTVKKDVSSVVDKVEDVATEVDDTVEDAVNSGVREFKTGYREVKNMFARRNADEAALSKSFDVTTQ